MSWVSKYVKVEILRYSLIHEDQFYNVASSLGRAFHSNVILVLKEQLCHRGVGLWREGGAMSK